MKSFYLAWVAILFSCVASNAATLTIKVGGSTYNGGPAFAAYMGNTELGRGATSDPIPKGGQTFTFEIEENVVGRDLPLDIRFTNDLNDAGGDRNLTVLGVSIGSLVFDPEAITVLRSGEVTGRKNGFLSKKEDVARIYPPGSGWTNEQQLRPVASLEAQTPPVVDGACPRPIKVSFPNGGHEITSANLAALNTAIGAPGMECTLLITGYSSTDGTADANLRLSEDRAQSVARYIEEQNPHISIGEVAGLGGTNDFGVPSENRVVVVSFE